MLVVAEHEGRKEPYHSGLYYSVMHVVEEGVDFKDIELRLARGVDPMRVVRPVIGAYSIKGLNDLLNEQQLRATTRSFECNFLMEFYTLYGEEEDSRFTRIYEVTYCPSY